MTTKGIEAMKVLGYIDTTDILDDTVIQFTKYDDEGYITDIINYFYDSDNGVQVYANNLTNECGSRIDSELLHAIQLNFNELDNYFKAVNEYLETLKNKAKHLVKEGK